MSRSQISYEKLMDATAVLKAGTSYSNSRDFSDCTGSATLYISSTAGSITVSQQCSMNNSDWYDPIDTSAAALGVVRAAQTVTTGIYVAYTPVLAKYIRFKVVEGNVAATTVTLTLSYRLEV